MVTWSLGWGHYCNGELDLAERWLSETAALAPPADQWIVGTGAIADLSLIAGLRGRHAEQLRLATAAVDQAREHGLLEAREVGEVHTAHGVALAAQGRREEALPALEQGVFLRRLWGQPLDLADGLIALATATAGVGDRERAAALFRETEELLAGCPDAGRPARAARRRDRGRRGGAERARARGAGAPERGPVRARDRPGAVPLLQHGPQPREVHLPQARRELAGGGGRISPR